jgi:hypothetical protein
MTAGPRTLVHRRERDEVIAVCCRAFWHDPLFDFLARHRLLDEYELLPAVFRAAMKDFDTPTARCDVIDVDGRPRALAAWLGPGSFPLSTTAQIPAYTGTQKHANVSWYARSGFEVIEELRLPSTPPIWRLWRDPTPPS